MRDDARIHGIITHGGDAPNVVPRYAAAQFFLRAAGLEPTPTPQPARGAFSTDFGNVSYLVPAVTGSFAISREPIPGHSEQVVDAARSEFGYAQFLKVSKAMALTALDLFLDHALLAEATEEHAHWAERYEGRRYPTLTPPWAPAPPRRRPGRSP